MLLFTNLKKPTMQIHAFRLKPGADLKKEIQRVVDTLNIKAGWILTCVGSLTAINLRFANQPDGHRQENFFEIASLAGTLSVNGSHLHISVSDPEGRTIGGHLLEGNIIYTTAELVIGYEEGMVFTREKDGSTNWAELQIRSAPGDETLP